MTHPPKKLTCEFLYVFSRFEYALKKTSFLTKYSNGVAKPDWNKFSKELDRDMEFREVESESFHEAINYFFEKPPKTQIANEEGDLDWADGEPILEGQQNFEKLFRLVRTARNNLFHGGKFHGEYISGAERDEILVKFGIIILEECLSFNSEVEREFRKEVFNVYDK